MLQLNFRQQKICDTNRESGHMVRKNLEKKKKVKARNSFSSFVADESDFY